MKPHIRVNAVRADRRINGSVTNPGDTLCGAAITDRDFLPADAWNMKRLGRLNEICSDCWNLIEKLTAGPLR